MPPPPNANIGYTAYIRIAIDPVLIAGLIRLGGDHPWPPSCRLAGHQSCLLSMRCVMDCDGRNACSIYCCDWGKKWGSS